MDLFRCFYMLNAWPPADPVVTVLAYCVHLCNSGLAPRTTAGHMAVIFFETQASGLLDPCKEYRVRKAVEGAKAAGKHHDMRAIRAVDLLRMAPSVRVSLEIMAAVAIIIINILILKIILY